MHIETIALRDFRNYDALRLSLHPGINVFFGDNAQGKTNLLEAVYLCCLGRSHRTVRDNELIRLGQKDAYACVHVSRSDGPRQVEVLLSQNDKKRIRVSGVPIRRMSELMGHVQCILFSPEDLLLVKGGPGARRRFLDSSLCQLRPAYFLTLSRYNALVLQRNALLRQSGFDTSLMETYEGMLSQCGASIVAHRQSFLKSLSPFAARVHGSIAGSERLTLGYRTQANGEERELEGQLLALYRKTREDDMRRFRTTIGPHRDDLALAIDGDDARAYASQGQQRTAALSLKLGSVAQMKAETGQSPVLMLDDVFSELDNKRQHALVNHIGGQALITTSTDPPALLSDSRRYSVLSGRISPQNE